MQFKYPMKTRLNNLIGFYPETMCYITQAETANVEIAPTLRQSAILPLNYASIECPIGFEPIFILIHSQVPYQLGYGYTIILYLYFLSLQYRNYNLI